MNKKTITVLVLLFALLVGGCNYTTRYFGGEMTVELEEGERLENVTWKEDSMWILTKQAPNIKPTTYEFKERSNFGGKKGTVHIIEK